MRCRQCDYPLWGIRNRTCPECGGAFAPSDFQFVRSAVAFHCPHCEQAYYGTTEQGHLDPRRFSCVTCGNALDMDEMILRPTEGVGEEATLRDGKNPWEARRGFGFFSGWLRTLWLSMFGPRKLVRMSGAGSRFGAALWFAVFSVSIFLTVGYGSLVLATSLFYTAPGGAGAGFGGGMFVAMMVGSLLFSIVSAAVMVLIAILIWAALSHGLLLLSGGAPRGIGKTMQAIGYGAGANAPTAIPLIGPYLSPITWIWWGISAGFMMAEGHKVTLARALVAALIPPALGFAATVGGFYWLISSSYNAVNRSAFLTAHSETSLVTNALQLRLNAGDLPHVVELVADGELEAIDLVLADSLTSPDQVVIAGRTLDEYENLSVVERAGALRSAAEELPDDVIAYRVGDFVFTHPGVAVDAPTTQSFWLVIAWPDPDVNSAPGPNDLIWIGDTNGAVTPHLVSGLNAMLAEQNRRRASIGLAPIPDPGLVRHGQPATAP